MTFPNSRPRRMRANENLRKLVRETTLSLDQLIMPYFLVEGKGVKDEIQSMPGQFRFSIDQFLFELEELEALRVGHILLFGIANEKDPQAKGAYDPNGVVQNAIREIKKRFPHLTVITDICLCAYMSHGHCGVVEGEKIANDPTLKLLEQTALSHAEAGSDIVAPSDMMDGRVGHIRAALDRRGFSDLPILSYAAKYASAVYGPFREAAQSTPQFGNRKTYQMDYANKMEALKEARQDICEGADIIMVKPALAYLDVISLLRQELTVPIAAYSVSGEYSLIKAAAAKNWVNEKEIVLESLTAIKRAGANIIITYHAQNVLEWLK